LPLSSKGLNTPCFSIAHGRRATTVTASTQHHQTSSTTSPTMIRYVNIYDGAPSFIQTRSSGLFESRKLADRAGPGHVHLVGAPTRCTWPGHGFLYNNTRC